MGGPAVAETGTPSVLVRRGLAALLDLLVIAVLAAAVAVALFQVVAVTGREGQTCDTVLTETVRRKATGQPGERGSIRRRWRRVDLVGAPSFCVQGERARYVELSAERSFTSLVALGAVGASFVALVLVQWAARGSIGKLLVGLRVVRRDGSRLGFGRTVWRWILLVADLACCLFPGVVMVLLAPDHRRIGDRGADAYVVGWSDARRELEYFTQRVGEGDRSAEERPAVGEASHRGLAARRRGRGLASLRCGAVGASP